MLESGRERIAFGASLRGAKAVVDIGLNFLGQKTDLTAVSRANKQNDPDTISGSDFA